MCAATFLVGPDPAEVPLAEAVLMPPHLVRPRWLAALPGHGLRLAWLIDLASRESSQEASDGRGIRSGGKKPARAGCSGGDGGIRQR